jgi:hypothetical protein
MLFYVLVLTLLRFTLCADGTVIPREPMSPVPNEVLEKRGYPANSITAYPDFDDYSCTGGDHYTWVNNFYTCTTYDQNGEVWSMSSFKATDFSQGVWLYVYSDTGCSSTIGAWAIAVSQDICLSFDEPVGSYYLEYAT